MGTLKSQVLKTTESSEQQKDAKSNAIAQLQREQADSQATINALNNLPIETPITEAKFTAYREKLQRQIDTIETEKGANKAKLDEQYMC